MQSKSIHKAVSLITRFWTGTLKFIFYTLETSISNFKNHSGYVTFTLPRTLLVTHVRSEEQVTEDMVAWVAQ